VIKSFAHKGLKELFYDGSKRGVPAKHADKLVMILDRLDAAARAEDMDYPGSALHRLKGKLGGHWAVKVSGNWRVVFRFDDGAAHVVDFVDYH